MDSYSTSGTIDNTDNLKSVAAYIVSGLTDTTVPPKNQQAIKTIYENYEVPDIEYVEKNIGHTVPNGQPVEALEWLYTTLGYASSFNAESA